MRKEVIDITTLDYTMIAEFDQKSMELLNRGYEAYSDLEYFIAPGGVKHYVRSYILYRYR